MPDGIEPRAEDRRFFWTPHLAGKDPAPPEAEVAVGDFDPAHPSLRYGGGGGSEERRLLPASSASISPRACAGNGAVAGAFPESRPALLTKIARVLAAGDALRRPTSRLDGVRLSHDSQKRTFRCRCPVELRRSGPARAGGFRLTPAAGASEAAYLFPPGPPATPLPRCRRGACSGGARRRRAAAERRGRARAMGERREAKAIRRNNRREA